LIAATSASKEMGWSMEPLFVCGPTASGKSAAALAICKALGGEIINADAFQLYRGLEVLTAAPGPADRKAVPHHLYGTIDPVEALDAARYRALALPLIEEVASRRKLPVVVGGSGLYLKFLTHEPAALPAADPALRRHLEALPRAELLRRLEERDPVEARRIDRHNPRYLQRALEVCLLTGRRVSDLRQSFQHASARLRGLLIEWPPAELEPRIRQRAAAMLDNGAIEEVRRHPELSPTAEKAIGIREIRALLAGEIDRRTCEERITVATRRYAKRQRTWFRRERWLRPVAGNAPRDELLRTAEAPEAL